MGQGRTEEIRLAVQDGSDAMPLALVLFGKAPRVPGCDILLTAACLGSGGILMCLPAGSCSRAAAPLCCCRPLDFSLCLYIQYSCRKDLNLMDTDSLNKHMNVVNFVVGDSITVYISSYCPGSVSQLWNCNVMSVCTMDS